MLPNFSKLSKLSLHCPPCDKQASADVSVTRQNFSPWEDVDGEKSPLPGMTMTHHSSFESDVEEQDKTCSICLVYLRWPHGGFQESDGPIHTRDNAFNANTTQDERDAFINDADAVANRIRVSNPRRTEIELLRPGCGHQFHKECLRGSLVISQICPLCRAPVDPSIVEELTGSTTRGTLRVRAPQPEQIFLNYHVGVRSKLTFLRNLLENPVYGQSIDDIGDSALPASTIDAMLICAKFVSSSTESALDNYILHKSVFPGDSSQIEDAYPTEYENDIEWEFAIGNVYIFYNRMQYFISRAPSSISPYLVQLRASFLELANYMLFAPVSDEDITTDLLATQWISVPYGSVEDGNQLIGHEMTTEPFSITHWHRLRIAIAMMGGSMAEQRYQWLVDFLESLSPPPSTRGVDPTNPVLFDSPPMGSKIGDFFITAAAGTPSGRSDPLLLVLCMLLEVIKFALNAFDWDVDQDEKQRVADSVVRVLLSLQNSVNFLVLLVRTVPSEADEVDLHIWSEANSYTEAAQDLLNLIPAVSSFLVQWLLHNPDPRRWPTVVSCHPLVGDPLSDTA